jgi:hypothetical protein
VEDGVQPEAQVGAAALGGVGGEVRDEGGEGGVGDGGGGGGDRHFRTPSNQTEPFIGIIPYNQAKFHSAQGFSLEKLDTLPKAIQILWPDGYEKMEEELVKRTERQIFCYDLTVTARAKHAVPPPLSDIVGVWQAMYAAGECSHERDKGNVIYRIGDITVDNITQTVRILLRRCDIDAANAVYSHRTTGVPRVATRHVDEGGDRAAHLVVSLKHEKDKPTVYLCHLEGMPGISHRLVQAALNSIIKNAITSKKSTFNYPDPSGARLRSGDPKMHSFHPGIELIGHQSEALVQDIENGQLHNITLVDQRPQNQLGGNQYLIENEYNIRVKASPNIPSQNRMDALISAIQSRKVDYQKAKVRFTDPNGITRTIDYDIATGTPEQQIYVKSYIVSSINPPMDESSTNLVPFLTDAMQARLVSERT